MGNILAAPLLLACLTLLAGHAAAREKQPPPGAETFEAGFPPPGASWVEKLTTQKGETETGRLTVMKDETYDGKPATRVSAGPGSFIYDRANGCLVAIVLKGKEIKRWSPHNGMFSPPLWVGKRWKTVFTYIDQVTGKRHGPQRTSHEVLAYEDVTVPAGTFKALKIQKLGEFDSASDTMSDLTNDTIWYSPELKVIVGMMYQEGLGVKKSKPESLKWCRKAAAQGHALAKKSLESKK